MSVFCHHIPTVDRGKLTERAGALSREVVAAVEQGLRAAVDLQ